jgi:RHS repeat-associated protein
MDVTTYDFISTTYTATNETTRTLGHKQYEISNHLGNVLSVITDQKLPEEAAGVIVSYSAVIITATDYSPFGVGLYGRSWSEGYRYGFNGGDYENDLSKGAYFFENRISHNHLARWLSIDPMNYKAPSWNPYRISFNNPIKYFDPDGNYEVKGEVSKEEKKAIKSKHKNGGTGSKGAKKEIHELKLQRIATIERMISMSKELAETDENVQLAFETFSGVKKGTQEWDNLFVNNGKGPLVFIDPNLKSANASGMTDMLTGTIAMNENTNCSDMAVTYLHELIHYTDPFDKFINDGTRDGLQNETWSAEFQRSAFQDVVDWSLANHPEPEKRKLENWILHYPDMITSEGKVTMVEVGYAFEKAAFGTIVTKGQAEKIVGDRLYKKLTPRPIQLPLMKR